MKVLVTGATGFIGRHLVNALLQSNCQVTVLVRDKMQTPDSWSDKVDRVAFSLGESVKKEIFKDQILIHLAWEGLPNYTHPIHYERNVMSSYEFIKEAITNGVRKVVVAGTCFEYGMVNGQLHEEMATNPLNAYGLAKDTLRKYLSELRKVSPFDFNWVRLFYMYGDGQNEKSFFSQLRRAIAAGNSEFNMSAGEQLRDYLPVEKVAYYLTRISLQSRYNGIVNCCSGVPVSLRSMAEKIVVECQSDIRLNLGYYPYPDYEPMAFWGDNTLLMKISEYA